MRGAAGFRKLLAPGFTSVSLCAALLVLVGLGQLCTLLLRSEPYPGAAILFALLLVAGGGALFAFVFDNQRAPEGVEPAAWKLTDLLQAARRPSPQAMLLASALGLLGALTVYLSLSERALLPAHLLLLGRSFSPADLTREPPLPMLVSGTWLLSLGVLAVCTCSAGAWLLLYALKAHRVRRAALAALGVLSALPYVGVLLVLRVWLCRDVTRLAAERWLENEEGKLAFGSLLGMAPGFLFGALALGLSASHGLWMWLERVRGEEERSDSFFLLTTVRRERPWRVLLRHGLWLRRRRELATILFSAMAASALIDVLSNTILDALGPGFPLAPTLGASFFLRPVGGPLPLAWAVAHALLFLACTAALLAQAMPPSVERALLLRGRLVVAGGALADKVPAASELAVWPHVQWVLGVSGAGKSSLLRCWAAQDERAVLVPQDPDEALSRMLSPAELSSLADASTEGGDVLRELLGRLDDERVRRGLADPFSSVAVFSRGERQRLTFALALSRAALQPDTTLLLDEPTSGQDASRARLMMHCLLALAMDEARSGRSIVTSHDPELIIASLDPGRGLVADDLVWLEGKRAHRLRIEAQAGRWRWAQSREAQPLPGLLSFQGAMDEMLGRTAAAEPPRAQRSRPPPPSPAREYADGRFALMQELVKRGGYHFHADPSRLRIGPGELAVLAGPSGAGKSTLLKQMADPLRGDVAVGWVPQEPARAMPAEMPVYEALGIGWPGPRDRDAIREWYGDGYTDGMLGRPVGSLSEGERQRVLLTAEVLHLERSGPHQRLRLLLMDEPFGSVDPAAHVRMMRALTRWLRAPRRAHAAVLVSHSPAADASLARESGVPVMEWMVQGAAT